MQYEQIKLRIVDTEQHSEDFQHVNELRLKNTGLQKELEREQLLHKMLYKDWEKLTEQMSAQKQEVYENSRPKNLFYKYGFYVLLIGLVPTFYFLYPRTDNIKSSSSQVRSDTIRHKDLGQNKSVAAITDSLPRRDSVSTMQKKQIINQNVTQQPVSAKPLLQPEVKKTIMQDSTKPALPIRKPEVEIPLTDDAKDSISSLGFIAYFNHQRNPYRKSSEKFKVWAQGWNEGKAEEKKLDEKDPSSKH